MVHDSPTPSSLLLLLPPPSSFLPLPPFSSLFRPSSFLYLRSPLQAAIVSFRIWSLSAFIGLCTAIALRRDQRAWQQDREVQLPLLTSKTSQTSGSRPSLSIGAGVSSTDSSTGTGSITGTVAAAQEEGTVTSGVVSRSREEDTGEDTRAFSGVLGRMPSSPSAPATLVWSSEEADRELGS